MTETESTAQRTQRELAEAAGDARARTPEDAQDASIPVAATVIVLRDGAAGPEVLVMERPDRGSFAGAWVFPGGRLEPGDVRDPQESEEDVARRAGARETVEEVGLQLDPAGFVTMSRWDPPPGLPLRIRTWFFATRGDDAELVLSEHEVVTAQWARPEELLERHGRGEITLYPPTWVTLHSLAGQGDVDAVLAMLRLRGVDEFDSIVRRHPTGPVFLWRGDAEYAEDAAGAGPEASARHRLETGALPWIYTRTVS